MINRIFKLVISMFFYLFYKFGLLILLFYKKKKSSILVILQYHSVSRNKRDKFSSQMRRLIRHSTPVHADFLEQLNKGKKYSSVTFDDGFQNVLKNALPELYKLKIPATLFIPTGYLGQRQGWIDQKGHEDYDELIINAKQLSNLPEELIMIGSHCVTHKDLTILKKSEIEEELIKSKNDLENVINRKVDLVAFPFGSYNEEVIHLAKKVGYKRCFSSVPSFPHQKIDKFLMGRIDVSLNDWPLEFRLKFLGAYQWLSLAISIKRMLQNVFREIL